MLLQHSVPQRRIVKKSNSFLDNLADPCEKGNPFHNLFHKKLQSMRVTGHKEWSCVRVLFLNIALEDLPYCKHCRTGVCGYRIDEPEVSMGERSPHARSRLRVRRPSSTPPIPSSPAAGSYTSSTYSSPSWGSLFLPSPSRSQPPIATTKLSRLLTSIASYLTSLAPESEAVVTKEKPAHCYGAFLPHPGVDHRGAYLGSATHRGLERLWSWMGCTYYLTPTAEGDLRPALMTGGFVTWSTVHLLLCPDLEVGVIDTLLKQVELRDPGLRRFAGREEWSVRPSAASIPSREKSGRSGGRCCCRRMERVRSKC
ncbi:hypothetical protein FN846DRAFT_951735 [Sphaerosporella brunnea]|uniref:DUF7514 domain-containing protein n=1 Tax=Sphaerosporella brunnea TaxID=1250544 RepID=A0A5J5EUZ3_9PEZI|nr:hypothetical protein FN846DRAFT_951735 [Sphaerosporella brunnea]